MSDDQNSFEQSESIAQGLFFGEVNEELIFPYPHFSAEQTEMGKTMADAFNKFAEDSIDSAKFDEDALEVFLLQSVAAT